MTALKDSPHHHWHLPAGEQLTQRPCPVNSLNIHEARQVCPHQDDIGTSVLVSPVNAAGLPVSPVDVGVQQREAVGMLHWRQQSAPVRAIEIRSLNPLKEEVEHHPILKTLLLLALTVASGKQSCRVMLLRFTLPPQPILSEKLTFPLLFWQLAQELQSSLQATKYPMINNNEEQNQTSVCASAQSSWDPALSTASPLGQPKLLLINTTRPEPSIPERSSLAFSPQSVQYIYLGKSQQELWKRRSEVLCNS